MYENDFHISWLQLLIGFLCQLVGPMMLACGGGGGGGGSYRTASLIFRSLSLRIFLLSDTFRLLYVCYYLWNK